MIQMAQGNSRMFEFEYAAPIITTLTGIFVVFGGAARWVITRIDKKNINEREWQNAERQKLELLFTQRIATLEQIIRGQNEELGRMRNQIASYSRHVGVLEGILRAKDIEIPSVPGALTQFPSSSSG